MQCQHSEDCLSITCRVSTTTPPSDSVTVTLEPCSAPIQLVVNGTLSGIGVLPEIEVQGLTQVPLNQEGLAPGLLQITKWILTDGALQFGLEVSQVHYYTVQIPPAIQHLPIKSNKCMC
jgi:hypothetical protein